MRSASKAEVLAIVAAALAGEGEQARDLLLDAIGWCGPKGAGRSAPTATSADRPRSIPPGWVLLEQAAELMGVSYSTLARWSELLSLSTSKSGRHRLLMEEQVLQLSELLQKLYADRKRIAWGTLERRWKALHTTSPSASSATAAPTRTN